MSTRWLSVIMPTYNGSRYLEEALQSLLAQQEPDMELVVVDDGSIDETFAILQSYSTQLRMTLVRLEHTGNWAANTNLGMSLAKGRYICWLHQDDTWCPQRLRQLKALATRWPNAVCLVHPAWFIDPAGRRVGLWRCPMPQRVHCVPSRQWLPHLLIHNFLAASAPLFLAEAAARAGGLDEHLWYLADWDFWLKLACLGDTAYHPRPLASFRLHPGSQTWTCPHRIADVERQYAVVHARHLASWQAAHPHDDAVAQAARFAAQSSLALMRCVGREKVRWFRLLWDFVALNPKARRAFLRDSRIIDRVVSRLRVRIRLASRTGKLDVPPPLQKAAQHGTHRLAKVT